MNVTFSLTEILYDRPTMKSQPLNAKYFKIFCAKGLEEKREHQKDLIEPSLKVDM